MFIDAYYQYIDTLLFWFIALVDFIAFVNTALYKFT